jgi:putative transposase
LKASGSTINPPPGRFIDAVVATFGGTKSQASLISITRWASEALPSSIRVDQGTEFVLRDLDLVGLSARRQARYFATRKSTDNAFIEAFNSRFRAECEERPHGAIGQKTPTMLLNHVGAASPPS